MNCCICQFSVRVPKDIHTETVGHPPVLISELVLQCTRGTDYVLADESSTICKKCCEKLARYHKSIQIARKLRQEILELIHSPYMPKDLKPSPLKEEEVARETRTITKFDGNIEEVEEEEDPDGEEHQQLVEVDTSAEGITLVDPTSIEEEVAEQEEHIFIIKQSEEEDEEYQSVDLDIDNEIIINEEEAHEVGEEDEDLMPHAKHEGQEADFFKEETMSDFDDHLDGTIEYIISDGEGDDQDQDHDSSGEYAVNIQCPSCPEKFTSRRAYNAHTKREHFPGYVCDQCGKTLQSYSGFIGHLQNHEPVKQFACPVCPERFSRKFRLKHHMAWHTGETPYQCEVCSKRFVHKVALYKHKMIHDNETKRLECQVCGFKTRTKAHLERHMRSHTGDKPFACPVCNKRFSQMYNMKAHLREHESPGTNRHRRYHCPKCTHTFINEQNYVAHVQRDDCTAV
ncbi:zinc finger and SCAN domain-containing protein 12 [Drosophila biarmipes]|uniref:zinc finger and SCAN domain-containing protein 12 n=1 Tax=Drosophila biarmipes TaxID=125945 RepID=UPI0007E77FA3|nr:zinc finger and SCAN domain-containing protein 12 [Drosophila biarmipes]